MSDTLMIVPTYQRLANVRRQLQAFADTGTTLDVLYACDATDPDISALTELLVTDRRHMVVTAGKSTMIEKLNTAAVNFGRSYRYVGFMGDDHLPRTLKWDQQLTDALDELGTGMAYPNDLYQGANCPTVVMLTSDIINELGYMTPPALQHMYCDVFWLDLCKQVDAVRYLPDTIVEHMHFCNGKAPMDDSYRRSNHSEVFARDKATYERYVSNEMPDAVRRIAALRAGR